MNNIQQYLEQLKKELLKLKENNFTGNIEYRFNFKQGSVTNINRITNTSIKL